MANSEDIKETLFNYEQHCLQNDDIDAPFTAELVHNARARIKLLEERLDKALELAEVLERNERDGMPFLRAQTSLQKLRDEVQNG